MSDGVFSELPEEVARSWKTHINAFGPILEPAFTEDIPTRIQLTAALNHIGSFNPNRGIEILCELEDRCICDADRCAWNFCMALGYEYSRKQELTVKYYYQCCQYSPDFYLPFLKVAKSAHTNQNFALARDYYRLTIKSISNARLRKDKNAKLAEASAASNLASCYTMMHDLPMAAMMLDYSSNILKELPGRNGTYAMLYAAMGDKENTEIYMIALKSEDEWMYNQMHQTVYEVLDGTHPHFHVTEPIKSYIDSFWEVFTQNESSFREQLDHENSENICNTISDILTNAFPCMKKRLRIRASNTGDGYLVELTDYYTATLMEGYKKLIADMPAELKKHWTFQIVHD